MNTTQRQLLSPLSAELVLGVNMQALTLLRLDRIDTLAPGNKSFKLKRIVAAAKARGVKRLVSFGGGWSNHLHALAAVGRAQGLETIALVRGEASEADTAMLTDAQAWGMQVQRISRAQYRQRHEAQYQAQLIEQFAPCELVPEGGASALGVEGCAAIGSLIEKYVPDAKRIVVPVGTGTTLAGIVAGLSNGQHVVGISALKGALDLESRVSEALAGVAKDESGDWEILHDFHCGGFARSNVGLREFMCEFERVQKIPLEPVYTGKMLYALFQLIRDGDRHWSNASLGPIVAVHTGGLQGRRGYDWLE